MVGACVILYILLYYSSVTVDVFTTVSLIFWFLGMLLNLGIVSMGAAYVNHVVSNEAAYINHVVSNEAAYINHVISNEAAYINHLVSNETAYNNHVVSN